MEPDKKMPVKAKRDVFEGLKDILTIVDCPVCLDIIRDPPIYICENSQGHSICSGCHRSLRNKRKPCPVCIKPLANRRSLGLEKLLELLPKTCRFEGCDQEAQDRTAMKKHEQDCDHRPVPCGWCDAKIGMQKLASHISKEHGVPQFLYSGLSVVSRGCSIAITEVVKSQRVLAVGTGKDPDRHRFLLNWLTLDEGDKMFCCSYIGPRAMAETFKYTLKVKVCKDSEEYLLESTRRCVPCDMSQEEMKMEKCGIFLNKKLVDDATEFGRMYFDRLIQKV